MGPRCSRYLDQINKHLTSTILAAVIAAAAGVGAALGGAGGSTAAAATGSSTSTGTTTASTTTTTTTTTKKTPLRVIYTGTRGLNSGAATITVRVSQVLAKRVPTSELPRLSPSIAGKWIETGPRTLVFKPSAVYAPGTVVKVTVPERLAAADGSHLRKPYSFSYTVGQYSRVRIAQLLAQLGYLPVKFVAAKADRKLTRGNLAEQRKLAYSPPRGSFKFGSGWPGYLHWLWWNNRGVVLNGAIRAFEYQHGLTMDGQVGPQMWAGLLRMAAANRSNSKGYTYALASKTGTETLTIWRNGRVVLRTPANTGISAAPTADGTFPVYLKLQSQVMKGKNPDGSSYADQVYWVSYFNGGDAVHYFDRGSYGWPQSLGCVELPWSAAQTSFYYLTYGSLVSVVG